MIRNDNIGARSLKVLISKELNDYVDQFF